MRNAIRTAPAISPLRAQLQGQTKAKHEPTDMLHAKGKNVCMIHIAHYIFDASLLLPVSLPLIVL